jgi:hypothetical protein
MPKLPLFVQPPAPQGPAEYISEDDPRKQTSFLDPITDFVRGMGYFPTEPVPKDASRSYTAGAALANAAPLVGPALKGLGMAAPLVTIFKNAEGVPSQAMRESSTGVFREMARVLPHRMRAAALQFAEDYPRIAAHMRPEYGLPPVDAPRASAYVATPAGKVTEPMKTGFTHIGRYYSETPQDYEQGLKAAREMMYHEGTHAAQALGNKDFNTLYNDANRLVGYDLNPFERTAERAGLRAGDPTIGKPALQGNRTAIDMLKDITALPSGSPNAERINNILNAREETPTADVFREAASSKPQVTRPAVDLSGLPGSLDYVQGLLRESGMAPMASHETSPAVQALQDALNVNVPESSLAQHAATSRVTGRLRPPREYIDLPEGFELAPGFKRGAGAPLGEEEQIWRDWSRAQKEMRKDPRGRNMGADVPEVRQQEVGPTARSIEELKNLSAVPGEVREQAPILAIGRKGRATRQVKEGRVALSQLTPEDIKEVQRAAGGGLNQKQLLEKYPQYTKETLRKIVSMPWKD